jgi:chromosome segregation ATPase
MNARFPHLRPIVITDFIDMLEIGLNFLVVRIVVMYERHMIHTLENRMTDSELLIQLIDEVRSGFARTDKRFERIDERFERIDERFERIDERFERIDERFERIEDRLTQLGGFVGTIESHLSRVEQTLVRHGNAIDRLTDAVKQQNEAIRVHDRMFDRVDDAMADLVYRASRLRGPEERNGDG